MVCSKPASTHRNYINCKMCYSTFLRSDLVQLKHDHGREDCEACPDCARRGIVARFNKPEKIKCWCGQTLTEESIKARISEDEYNRL
jgi:hypothetical protein